MNKKMTCLKTIFLASLSGLIFLSSTPAQDKKQTQVDFTPTAESLITAQEKIDIYPKLQNAEEVVIPANNPANAGLAISKATVKAVKRDESRYMASDVASSFVTDYVMQANFTFRNLSNMKITGVGLKFTHTVTHSVFFVYPQNIDINVAGEQQLQINFMAVAGSPTSLNVEVAGLRFVDSSTWKNFPLPPTNVAPRPQIANPQVDTKPRPLNSLRPRYTELARKNQVLGNVRLQIKIGADGTVQNVQVVNALPDGLTEEAIHVVKVLQFKPAMAGGSPVEYSIILDIEFYLT